MQHKYAVRFARTDPETPPTMDEQIDLARDAARKLGIPNCESKPDVSIELPRSCDTGDTRMSDNLQNGTRFGGQHDFDGTRSIAAASTLTVPHRFRERTGFNGQRRDPLSHHTGCSEAGSSGSSRSRVQA